METKFKQTEIGIIPEDWEVKPLDEVSEIIDCLHSKKPPKAKEGYIYLEVFNLIPETASINMNNLEYVSGKDYLYWTKRAVPEEGDLVITNTGIAATAIIPKNFNCCIGRNMTLIQSKPSLILPDFFRFYSLSNLFKREVQRLSLSGTILESLHVEFIGKIKIAVPSIEEQRKIVDCISPVFGKVKTNEGMNKTLEAIGQAIFKHWFVDFEFQNEEDKPYKSSGGEMVFNEALVKEIPKGWRVSKIGDELKTVLGGTPSTTKKSYWERGTIGWINSGKINEFRITEPTAYITEEAVNNSATKLLPKGTAVLAITGATLGQVSRIEIGTCANQSVIGIIESKTISSEYIYFWIKYTIGEIIRNQTGGAQQHINKNNVDNSTILIPSEKVIEEYQRIIKPIFDKISLACFESLTLSQLRDLLLPKLMSGKIRVPLENEK